MRVAVIGAGPAGLTAAVRLIEQGHSVDLFEASGRVGGMAQSFDLWGQRVDLGPHRFFSKDKVVNEFWLRFTDNRYRMVDRLTRIRYHDRFIQYPLELLDLLRTLQSRELGGIALSYFKERLAPSFDHTDTFESWVVNRFGRSLYELFFKSYSEKLWGIGCHELAADFAAQRIKNLSLIEVAKSLYQKNSAHASLVNRFAYPIDGSGQVYSGMAAHFVELGGRLHLSTPVQSIACSGNRVTGVAIAEGRFVPCDELVSTMPLTQMVQALPDTPEQVREQARQLRFRSTILVYVRLRGSEYFPDNWIYVHSPDLAVGRITNFRNWVPEIVRGQSETILCMEYWCSVGDEVWALTDEQLARRACTELPHTGLVSDEEILESKVIRIPLCYPVYEIGYERRLQTLVEHVNSFSNLRAIGRYGAFKYNNQDHSILMGLRAAEVIDSVSDNSVLWDINTDYHSYYEEGFIDEYGIQTTVSS